MQPVFFNHPNPLVPDIRQFQDLKTLSQRAEVLSDGQVITWGDTRFLDCGTGQSPSCIKNVHKRCGAPSSVYKFNLGKHVSV